MFFCRGMFWNPNKAAMIHKKIIKIFQKTKSVSQKNYKIYKNQKNYKNQKRNKKTLKPHKIQKNYKIDKKTTKNLKNQKNQKKCTYKSFKAGQSLILLEKILGLSRSC